MIPLSLLWLSLGASDTADLGAADDGRGPLAVVLPQPGLRSLAYVELANSLEMGGYDAVVLRASDSPEAQATSVARVVARAQEADRPLLLVAHGQSARALLEAGTPAEVCAVALLGMPRQFRPAPWHTPFLEAELPPSGVDLRAPHPAAPGPLVDAVPASWRGRMSAAWVRHLRQSIQGVPPALPAGPTWIGLAPLDELAPPENLGSVSSTPVVTRWGMLRGWSHDATLSELLTDPRPAAHLVRWSHSHCI